MELTASAPAKLVLLGDYAVLKATNSDMPEIVKAGLFDEQWRY